MSSTTAIGIAQSFTSAETQRLFTAFMSSGIRLFENGGTISQSSSNTANTEVFLQKALTVTNTALQNDAEAHYVDTHA